MLVTAGVILITRSLLAVPKRDRLMVEIDQECLVCLLDNTTGNEGPGAETINRKQAIINLSKQKRSGSSFFKLKLNIMWISFRST